ncbi:trypsin alpha-3 [Drosophila innubila]|uniref:trypsin alpha-3 n=1 Tax=Drosophila innubila TaxID=198719 RepID=UPI00148BE258|nr:trypsin alpha-3 [Drosophila innubila]
MFWKSIVIILGLLASANCAVIPNGLIAQRDVDLDGRIVGGSQTSISSHPWQVSLQRSGLHFCGGSVISSTMVVTAAHCLLKVTVPTLRVRAGSTYRSIGGVISNAAAFKIHEGYSTSTKINDIGVVWLKTKLTLGANIKAIQLATATPQHGAAASCSGWGSTSYNGGSSSHLLYIDTRIVARTECGSSSYGHGSKIRETMICAAGSNKDACQGDSGGPLVSGGKLVGIVSWGTNCALAKYPGVYANVADLRDWVIKQM